MSVVDNRIVTHALIYTDDASHNTPSYIYAKQYDKNSRYVNIKLMSADGQVVVSTPSKLNATKPDGNTLYISGMTEADGTVTFKIAASIIDQIGVVSCDVTVLDGSTQESVLLTSSTFYITVDKTNYDLDAPEASDDYVMAARAGDLATSIVEGETILHLVDTNGDAMGRGVPFNGGGGSNVQSDWNQNDSSAPDYIKNKPTIPAPITVDSTVTSTGVNPVSGSGIYSAIQTAIQDAQFDYNNYVDLGLITPLNDDSIIYFTIDSEQYDAIEASYNTRTDSTVVFRIGATDPTYYLVHKALTTEFEGTTFLGYTGVAVNPSTYDSGTAVVGFAETGCVLHFEYIAQNMLNAIDEANAYTDSTFANAETIDNKTTSISASSTDAEYPSAKAVYDAINAASSGIYEMQPFASAIKMTETQYVVTYKGVDKNTFLTRGSSLHIIKFSMSIDNIMHNFYGFSNGLQIYSGSVNYIVAGVAVSPDLTSSVPFIAKFNTNVSYPSSDDSGVVTFTPGSGGNTPSDLDLKVFNIGPISCTKQTGYYSYAYTTAQHNKIYELWGSTAQNGNFVVTADASLNDSGVITELYLFTNKSKLETIDGNQYMTFAGVTSGQDSLKTREFIIAVPYQLDAESGRIYFVEKAIPSAQCETAAGTASKAADCSNFALLVNSYVHVNIRYSNTAAGALTLNVNSKGAKPIYINGEASSASNYTLPAGTYIAYYDGTAYQFRTDGRLPGKIMEAMQADEVPWTGIQNRPDLSHVTAELVSGTTYKIKITTV